MIDNFCDFIVLSRSFGRTTVKEFTASETTELLGWAVECITGKYKEVNSTGTWKAKYVRIYAVSYEGEMKEILSWWNQEDEKEMTCPDCKGTGKEKDCPRCQGKKGNVCVLCNGKGYILCSRCLGHGTIEEKKEEGK